MESNITNAFILLGIGMVTVFVVLSLVVLCGASLIKLMNRIAPPAKEDAELITPLISNKEIAVLTAIVEHLTLGRGKIDSIDKI